MTSSYLLAGQATELARLQLQSRVWEPAGRDLLANLPHGPGVRALDVGCGVMGWLRLLSVWAGPDGKVMGADVDERMLAMARDFVANEQLGNVALVKDDLFSSQFAAASFDLVHARFQLAPLGRHREQVDAYLRLVTRGGVLVLEDPDTGSWHFNPPAPACDRLIALIERSFLAGGGDFNAGRTARGLLASMGLAAEVRAHAIALEPGHPYLRLPLQFASALRPRLLNLVQEDELDRMLAAAEGELQAPGRWGTTFTLIQTWTRPT